MTSAARNRPISSHPAFRWAVGLWFAALLGGGLFVMPDAVHAGLRRSLGLEAMLPAGLPGNAALSGAAALFGLLLGLVIAMRVAALNAAQDFEGEEGATVDPDVWLSDEAAVEDAALFGVADEEPRRPFNPRDYLTDEGIEGWTGDAGAEAPVEAAPAVLEEDGFAIEDYLPEAAPVCEDPAEGEPVADHDEDAEDAEWVPEEIDPVAEPAVRDLAETASAAGEPTAFGDLTLAELTARLGHAIEARRTAGAGRAGEPGGDVDPVIAFLRREADRAVPVRNDAPDSDTDPQAVLRGALDRLSQVSNPR
ncbi:MAG: hypothetical protein WC692_02965 [Erythrobacter sp.]|jgi:hypothetical protein